MRTRALPLPSRPSLADRFWRWLASVLPKGLYARPLIIIIAPVVLLQSVIAYVFMERHWQLVTRRLSSAVTADIAALIDVYETYPQDRQAETLSRIASERLGLDLDVLPDATLPPPGPKPFFSILDEALSEAAESFGKGREIEFRPRGAREVRQAGHAFLEMKRRIERAIEQRTAMLNGVSHDLRTILTRFRLSLALLGETPEIEDLKRDIDEMTRMLEGYLAFARGDAGEQAVTTDLRGLLEELKSDAERHGHPMSLDIVGDPMVTVRPDAFRRLLFNLVSNAARHGERIAVQANHETRWLVIHVDDDGPGIPPALREEVFKPFVRLDEARNQDEGGSGLGLAIARDIARSHGGDIVLDDSPLGGLRATVRLPA